MEREFEARVEQAVKRTRFGIGGAPAGEGRRPLRKVAAELVQRLHSTG